MACMCGDSECASCGVAQGTKADPRPFVDRCACPHRDPLDCFAERYRIGATIDERLLLEELCECACHDDNEDDDAAD